MGKLWSLSNFVMRFKESACQDIPVPLLCQSESFFDSGACANLFGSPCGIWWPGPLRPWGKLVERPIVMQDQHGHVERQKGVELLMLNGAVHGNVLVPKGGGIKDAKATCRTFWTIRESGKSIICGKQPELLKDSLAEGGDLWAAQVTHASIRRGCCDHGERGRLITRA